MINQIKSNILLYILLSIFTIGVFSHFDKFAEPNLILNNKFEIWSKFWKPENWSVFEGNETNKYCKPFGDSIKGTGIWLSKNKKIQQYIYQKIKVKKNKKYEFNASVFYNINKYTGGFYILNNENRLLIKSEEKYFRGHKDVKLIFNTKKTDTIILKIGFLNKGTKGDFFINYVSLDPFLEND